MDKFSPKHFIFLMLGTSVVSLKTYPTTFMRDGQRDSWIAIIIASAIIFLVYLYFFNIWKKNKHGLVEIYRIALGKYLGNIFICIYIYQH